VLDTGLLLPSLRIAGGTPELNPLDPINRGRIGFWPMLEGGGIGTRDISGWNRHATFSAIPSRVAARWGRAPLFVRAATNRATAPQLPALPGLTMAFWLAADAVAGGAIYSQPFSSDGTSTARLAFSWDHLNSAYRQSWTTYSGGSYPVVKYPTTLAAGQAYFLAATTDGTTLRIYQDGVLVGSTTGASISAGSGLVSLGGAPANTAWWSGRAGLFSVWDHALSPSEMQRLAAEPLAGILDPAARLFHAVRLASGVTVSLTGIALTSSAGTVTPQITATPTGIAAASASGTATSALAVTTAGEAMTLSAGSVAYSIAFTLTGAATTSASGSLTGDVSGQDRTLTGISMTALPGNVRVTGGTRWYPQAARAESPGVVLGNTLPPPPRPTGNDAADLRALWQWTNTLYDQFVKAKNVMGRMDDHEARINKLEGQG
jgi:hypothetical protein